MGRSGVDCLAFFCGRKLVVCWWERGWGGGGAGTEIGVGHGGWVWLMGLVVLWEE